MVEINAMRFAAFLDRDGTIIETRVVNGVPIAETVCSEIRVLPKVKEALEILRSLGYEIIVVTNQPDVSRGKTNISSIDQIHRYIQEELGIDRFYVCYHDDSDECNCRKPKTELIFAAARELSINVAKSVVIGDRWRDVELGQRVGCRTFYIDMNYAEKRPIHPYERVISLHDAALKLRAEANGE